MSDLDNEELEATKMLNEKICEYCKTDMEGKILEKNCATEMIIDYDFLYTYCMCGRHSVISINYCPMCRKKVG